MARRTPYCKFKYIGWKAVFYKPYFFIYLNFIIKLFNTHFHGHFVLLYSFYDVICRPDQLSGAAACAPNGQGGDVAGGQLGAAAASRRRSLVGGP